MSNANVITSRRSHSAPKYDRAAEADARNGINAPPPDNVGNDLANYSNYTNRPDLHPNNASAPVEQSRHGRQYNHHNRRIPPTPNRIEETAEEKEARLRQDPLSHRYKHARSAADRECDFRLTKEQIDLRVMAKNNGNRECPVEDKFTRSEMMTQTQQYHSKLKIKENSKHAQRKETTKALKARIIQTSARWNGKLVGHVLDLHALRKAWALKVLLIYIQCLGAALEGRQLIIHTGKGDHSKQGSEQAVRKVVQKLVENCELGEAGYGINPFTREENEGITVIRMTKDTAFLSTFKASEYTNLEEEDPDVKEVIEDFMLHLMSKRPLNDPLPVDRKRQNRHKNCFAKPILTPNTHYRTTIY